MAAARTGPRPWLCNTTPGAVFCTLHGDCSCPPRSPSPNPFCPMHGIDTDHPSAPRLVAPR